MKTQAIIPAAGLGSRMNLAKPKPLIVLNGKPLFLYALERIAACDIIDSMIVVVSRENIQEFETLIARHQCPKVKAVVQGGKERADSVYQGLKATDSDTEIVLVHDGARPLVSRELVEESVRICYKEKAVIAAVPVKPTIKVVDAASMTVKSTLNRTELWEVQTPQVFRRDILLQAHDKRGDGVPSDDAMLVEELGIKVKVVQGHYHNIKVTTLEDLVMAEALLNDEN